MSEPIKEWTAEMVEATLKDRPFAAQTIASHHNAALAAERIKVLRLEQALADSIREDRLQLEQLVAEREKHGDEMTAVQLQLNKQLAAEREKGLRRCPGCGREYKMAEIESLEQQLAAERERYREGGQSVSEQKTIASEASHWYTTQGEPMYEVPRAKGDGMRQTTLADARKLDLVPSVTAILRCASQPGLEQWKATQLLESALTLPRKSECKVIDGKAFIFDEPLDDYAKRVIEDSKEQGKKARETGTELHAAIERYIQSKELTEYQMLCLKVVDTVKQYGIDLFKGKPEHSFASPLGYGGKLDWHNDEIVIDFKTKDKLTEEVKTKKGIKVKDRDLAWPEHCWQLAAYSFGAARGIIVGPSHRLINVFIGIDDCEVRIHEWPKGDALRGWKCFKRLLEFWQIKNQFGDKL